MNDNEKPNILLTLPARPVAMTKLDDAYTVHRLWEAEDKTAFLTSIGDRIRAVATSGERGVTAEEMAMLPNLEIISCFSVGVDAVDHEACEARGIPVTNTPDVLSKDVADLAIGLTLMVLRRMLEADRYVRSGRWASEGMMRLATSLQGRKLGILGMGRIGHELARRAEVFDMEIAYHNRRKRDDVVYDYHADLASLARWADVLALTIPGGPATLHMVDKTVLEALGPDGVLINVARGSVVDETALIEALQSGTIAAAGLDVFEKEPNVPQALVDMDNVVLQPHQASATDDTRDAMANLVVDNLKAHFAGQPLLTPYRR
jgi:lactate dehydrogenase-like 2-hydroxyacid dehydrogenase